MPDRKLCVLVRYREGFSLPDTELESSQKVIATDYYEQPDHDPHSDGQPGGNSEKDPPARKKRLGFAAILS